jgi:hypothetical protein
MLQRILAAMDIAVAGNGGRVESALGGND